MGVWGSSLRTELWQAAPPSSRMEPGTRHLRDGVGVGQEVVAMTWGPGREVMVVGQVVGQVLLQPLGVEVEG